MFNQDFLKKLESENALTPQENALLEIELEGAHVPNLLKAMPEDQLSMTWRSSLNERLHSLGAQAQRRSRRWMVLRPALGLGFAGALALVFALQVVPTERPGRTTSSNLEARLINLHESTASYTEIAGPGLAAHEAVPVAQNASVEAPWSEADIESL